jgi:hypothetical protein
MKFLRDLLTSKKEKEKEPKISLYEQYECAQLLEKKLCKETNRADSDILMVMIGCNMPIKAIDDCWTADNPKFRFLVTNIGADGDIQKEFKMSSVMKNSLDTRNFPTEPTVLFIAVHFNTVGLAYSKSGKEFDKDEQAFLRKKADDFYRREKDRLGKDGNMDHAMESFLNTTETMKKEKIGKRPSIK